MREGSKKSPRNATALLRNHGLKRHFPFRAAAFDVAALAHGIDLVGLRVVSMVVDLGIGPAISAGTLVGAQQDPQAASLGDDRNGALLRKEEIWTGVREGPAPSAFHSR